MAKKREEYVPKTVTYRWETEFKKMKEVADELWYAAKGLSAPTPTALKYWLSYPEHSLERPMRLIGHDVMRYIDDHNVRNAAMLYEILIQYMDMSIYIAHQMGNIFGKALDRPEPMIEVFNDVTTKAYDTIFYTDYIQMPYPSAPARSRIFKPMASVSKREASELLGQLWGYTMSRAVMKWGVKEKYMPQMQEVKARMNYLIDESLRLAEEAEKFTISGDFLSAAASYTEAMYIFDVYGSLSRRMRHLLGSEFGEIDVHFINSFKYNTSHIKDLIGMR